MIELFDFQHKAVAQITDRFVDYWSRRPGKVVGTNVTYTPFYQALASLTASGKTIIMAETVSQLLPVFSAEPIVLWLSKGRVVVDQTVANLSGKYRHLLSGYEDVRLLAEYTASDAEDESLALIYLATVGTFNQKSKDKGSLKLFQSDIDNADKSIWDALKHRFTAAGVRRPLLIVYDEAHNLTDQQTELLMELEPDALLLASATPKLPQAILKVVTELKDSLGWEDTDLTTYVASKDVVEAGLVKRQVLLGGYQAQMEETIDDLLAQMQITHEAVESLGLSLKPKAIYVCRTNIVEGDSYRQDDPKRPFEYRQAPPILIWRHLVERNVAPASIAVYTSALKFDKNYPPPADFVHFKGGDADYANFVAGEFRHIIFNLGLQEGWDDPEVYFAYIDKSMHSNIQVEQVIGRVLRQPDAQHYEAEELNNANFYVRIDAKGVFADIVRGVSDRIAADLPEITISAYDPKKRTRPVPYAPKKKRTVPHVWRDPSAARDEIDRVIEEDLLDFRNGTPENIQGMGARALVQQRVGEPSSGEVEWVEREHANKVSARWVFQTAVRRQFPLALQVTPSDHVKFDALIELGSPADTHVRKIADQIVHVYLQNVTLHQNLHNPYVVGDVMVDPSKAVKFTNALHDAYSGLNKTLELPFAQALDKQRVVWCRNPSRSGYPVPLLTTGQSRNFYPDFLAWKAKTVFALDTKGEHILEGELGRKLLKIEPHPKAKASLLLRLISRGTWDNTPQRVGGDGYTVWALGHANALKPIHCATQEDAVKTALRSDL